MFLGETYRDYEVVEVQDVLPTSLTLRQGIEMGRPSVIGLSIDATAEGPSAVRIKGSAVAISSGQIRRP